MDRLKEELLSRGADCVFFVDISELPSSTTCGYQRAVLLGLALSPGYIQHESHSVETKLSAFTNTEHAADELSEWAADYLIGNGYSAFAQSERHVAFDEATKSTPLPHKTLAVVAGLGWIGNNNLLVTREYGCAVCLGTVLTDAPLATDIRPLPASQCRDCNVCKAICPTRAITGAAWKLGCNREALIDVFRCVGCLKCLLHCPWTQAYMDRNLGST